MASNHDELGRALLNWIDSFKLASKPVKSWADLQDGQVLWCVLRSVSPTYFAGDLPEPSHSDEWIPRWQNLKHVHHKVTAFVSEECGKLQALMRSKEPNLKAIALEASKVDSIELTKLTLLAALYSPNSNQQMVQTMERLGPALSKSIESCIEELIALDAKISKSSLSPDTGSSLGHLPQDPYLQQEQQLIEAIARISALEDINSDMMADLQKSQQSVTSLERELEQAKERLESLSDKGSLEGAVHQMRFNTEQDKDYIAALEHDLEESKELVQKQNEELRRLKKAGDDEQTLRDQIQILQVERDDLLQKLRAGENLKKKILTLQDSAKSQDKLRSELDEARRELQSLQSSGRVPYETLLNTSKEHLNIIEGLENDIFEHISARQQLEEENGALMESLEAEKAQHARHTEYWQERVHELENSEMEGTSTLDEELFETIQMEHSLKTENDRLKAELLEANGVSFGRRLSGLSSPWQPSYRDKKSDPFDKTTTADDVLVGPVTITQPEEDKAAQETDPGLELFSDDVEVTMLQLRQDSDEGREALQQATEHSAHQDIEIASLRSRLQEATDHASSLSAELAKKMSPSPSDITLSLLQRELTIMTHAWYDLNSRLQSDGVTVQRRLEAPRGFLNRQRRVVEGRG